MKGFDYDGDWRRDFFAVLLDHCDGSTAVSMREAFKENKGAVVLFDRARIGEILVSRGIHQRRGIHTAVLIEERRKPAAESANIPRNPIELISQELGQGIPYKVDPEPGQLHAAWKAVRCR